MIPVIIAVGCSIVGVGILAQRGSRNLLTNAPPIASTEAERRILSVLDQARENGQVYLQVPVSSGRMLRVLAEAVHATSVVEIGTSTGYSGLWLCLALVNTGGKLTTLEIDRGRAAAARSHFQQAGVADRVRIIEGDAHVNIKRVDGPVDVVFLDADKQGYVDYLKQVLPMVRPGGLIIADNFEMATDYEKLITTSPHLETVFSGGMSITLKKQSTGL
jgi:predicted O-methyltransferase YrrM